MNGIYYKGNFILLNGCSNMEALGRCTFKKKKYALLFNLLIYTNGAFVDSTIMNLDLEARNYHYAIAYKSLLLIANYPSII